MTLTDPTSDPSPDAARFHTTRWSLVLAASREDSDAAPALAELCQTYWPTIYGFIRRRGHSVENAQDLTQAFVAELLERDLVRRANSERGRFRSFLLGACKNFLSHERERDRAQKRGGHLSILSFDFEEGEAAYRREPAHEETAERLFERRWALTLLETVLERLRIDFIERGKEDLFRELEPFLTTGDPAIPYREVAARVGLTENATKVAVHRLRRQYRDLLRDEVAATLADPSEIEGELAELMRALG